MVNGRIDDEVRRAGDTWPSLMFSGSRLITIRKRVITTEDPAATICTIASYACT